MCASYWGPLMKMKFGALMRKIFGGQSPPSLSLPAYGITMATSDSSLSRVSTVTDPLSFIRVAGATQPLLIDGISALLQQRGWEVGLLAIDFQAL